MPRGASTAAASSGGGITYPSCVSTLSCQPSPVNGSAVAAPPGSRDFAAPPC